MRRASAARPTRGNQCRSGLGDCPPVRRPKTGTGTDMRAKGRDWAGTGHRVPARGGKTRTGVQGQ
eukprot:1127710-Prymnesium_polylepis.1